MTRVLSLTTTTWRSFYETQVSALETVGVEYETLDPPGEFRAVDGSVRQRSIVDYGRFYPTVLRESIRGYDLVHANYGLTAPFALAQPVRPVVLTLWGGEFIGNRYERLIRSCTRCVDEVIVPSAAMAERLDRETHVVPFPVDTDVFRPIPREKARARLGWDDDYVVLFPYATSRYEKNYPLAKRVADAIDLDADVVLRTVSNEPYEEIPYYMNASDAVLVTSRWESGPMVIKEAVACNVPVVSTDVGFAADVLEGVSNSSVGGSVPELAGALEAALSSCGRSDGSDRITDYGISEMGRRLRDVYDRATAP